MKPFPTSASYQKEAFSRKYLLGFYSARINQFIPYLFRAMHNNYLQSLSIKQEHASSEAF